MDEEIGDLFLLGEEPSVEQLVAGIKRATLVRSLTPVFVGTALKNLGKGMVAMASVGAELITAVLDRYSDAVGWCG